MKSQWVWAKPTVLIKVSAYGAKCPQLGLGQRPKVLGLASNEAKCYEVEEE